MTSDPTYPEFKDEAIRWLLVTGRLRHELVMRMLDTSKDTPEYERIMGGLEALKILGERMHPGEGGGGQGGFSSGGGGFGNDNQWS